MRKVAVVLLGLSLAGCAANMDELKHPIKAYKARHQISHKAAPATPPVVAVPVKPIPPGTFEIKPAPAKRRWLPHFPVFR